MVLGAAAVPVAAAAVMVGQRRGASAVMVATMAGPLGGAGAGDGGGGTGGAGLLGGLGALGTLGHHGRLQHGVGRQRRAQRLDVAQPGRGLLLVGLHGA